jgi:hypothetical protein
MSLFNRPISIGIEPVRQFELNVNSLREIILPIDLGIVPVINFEFNDILVIIPLPRHVTPVHVLQTLVVGTP